MMILPIDVTVLGIITLDSEVHDWYAELPYDILLILVWIIGCCCW